MGAAPPLNPMALTLVATLWFAAAVMLIKALGPGVPAVWTAFLRNVLAVPFLLLILRRQGRSLSSPNLGKLVLRGVLATLAMLCNFWALPRLPLANASLLGQTSQLFTVAWGVLFLNERLSRFSTGCAVVSFIGVYVSLHPSFDYVPAPALAALAGALLSSLSFATLKSLTNDEPSVRIVAYFTLVGALLLAPLAAASGYRPSVREFLMMAGVALTATCGQIFLTMGVERTQVSKASIASVFSLVLGILGGMAFFGEMPDAWTWLGCLMVAGGIVGLIRDSRERLLLGPSG